MRRTLTETDFILAAFVFCASLIVAVYAYASIQEIERPSNALVSGLTKGEKSYKILFGNDCPGDLSVTMAYDAVWGLRSHGHLRVAYGKMLSDPQMEAAAYFNPLGQLNNARVEMREGDYSVVLTLTNPHPITIDVETKGNGPQYHEHFTIPGPFTIQRNGDGTYRIDYAYFTVTQNPSVKALQGFASHELNMGLVDAAQAPKGCDDNGQARLNLLPLIVRSSGLVSPILSLMNADEFKGR